MIEEKPIDQLVIGFLFHVFGSLIDNDEVFSYPSFGNERKDQSQKRIWTATTKSKKLHSVFSTSKLVKLSLLVLVICSMASDQNDVF